MAWRLLSVLLTSFHPGGGRYRMEPSSSGSMSAGRVAAGGEIGADAGAGAAPAGVTSQTTHAIAVAQCIAQASRR